MKSASGSPLADFALFYPRPFRPDIYRRTAGPDPRSGEHTEDIWRQAVYHLRGHWQRQRQLETRARKYREDVHLLDQGGGSEAEIIAKKCRYQGTLQEYKDFSDKMDLPMQKERIYQDGLKVDMRAPKKNIAANKKSDIIKSSKRDMNQQIQSIEQRNTARGKPPAVTHFGAGINTRQSNILDHLRNYDSEYLVKKKSVSMTDLAALTAETGDEFALFTCKGERLIIRGDSNSVNVTYEKALELRERGYRWSGHTHPGNDDFVLFPSAGDIEILRAFGQEQSVIFNSVGKFYVFERGE